MGHISVMLPNSPWIEIMIKDKKKEEVIQNCTAK
jgi:hypothetical protein